MQEVVRSSVPKSAEKGVFEGKICMSAILEKRGSFFIKKIAKIVKRGSHLSHTVIIFGQLGENNLIGKNPTSTSFFPLISV